MMNDTILSTKDLTFAYPKGSNLSFADLDVAPQQHTLILGDSGTGKSTLLHLLGGLSAPAQGKVFIKGQDIYALSEAALDKFRAQNIGIIFQEAHLLRNLTLSENIKLAQSLAGYKADQNKVDQVLAQLDLSEHRNKLPHQLSRGQLQRAAIARSVINRPAILIADEPTASLDDSNTARVLALLKTMADQHGATLIIATHDKRIKDQFSNTYLLDREFADAQIR